MTVSLSIIGDLLTQLLRVHNRVSLPGLGAFISEYKPATIIKNGRGILPPAKMVTFSTAELWNDGFLEEALAEKGTAPLSEVQQELAHFIKEVDSLLREGKRVEFPDFGTMRITADGIYYFEKDEDINLLPDAFGLLELDIAPLSYDVPPPAKATNREPAPTAAVQQPAVKPEAASIIAPLPAIQPLATTPLPTYTNHTNTQKPEKPPRRKCSVVCWIFLSLLLLAIAAFVGRSLYIFYSNEAAMYESIAAIEAATHSPPPAAPHTTAPAKNEGAKQAPTSAGTVYTSPPAKKQEPAKTTAPRRTAPSATPPPTTRPAVKQQPATQATTTPPASQEKARTQPPKQLQAETAIDPSKQTNIPKVVPPAQKETQSKRTNFFHIMLGRYNTEAEAKAAMKKQQDGNGCSCMILHTGGQQPYKVSAFRYHTKGEADEILSVFQRTDQEYKNAWVEKY